MYIVLVIMRSTNVVEPKSKAMSVLRSSHKGVTGKVKQYIKTGKRILIWESVRNKHKTTLKGLFQTNLDFSYLNV